MKSFCFALFFFSFVNLFSQKKISYGIENSLEYNFRLPQTNDGSLNSFAVFHEDLLFTCKIKNHLIFIGPQYSRFTGFMFDPADNYLKNSIGINFGYQYEHRLSEKFYRTYFFTRLFFSIYNYNFYEHSLLNGNALVQKTILENNLSFGLKKYMSKKFYSQICLGFGSTQGFFLMLESFMISSSIGLGIQF